MDRCKIFNLLLECQRHPSASIRTAVLFDGDCGICTQFAELARKLDADGVFLIQPYFEFSEDELARYGLSYEKCVDYLQVIGEDGQIYSGHNAVNYVGLRFFPVSVLFGLLYLLPPLLWLEAIGYALVAKNRTKISATLGLNACRVRTI